MRISRPPARLLFATLGLAWVALLGLPAPAGARDVEVGVFVTSLSDVSPDDGSFRIALYVWFNDPAGTFEVERDLAVLARTATVTEIETDPRPGGGTYTYARVEALVPHEFDFHDFPFDRQRLVLRLEPSEAVDALRFVPDRDDSGVSEHLRLVGWSVDEVAIDVEEQAYDSDFGWDGGGGAGYSQAVVTIDASRRRSPVLLDEFLGFTFAFLVTGLTFFVSCTELGLRVGMTTGSLFAALVNLNRLHDAAGFRPDFGMVDRLAFLVFGAILCSLVVAIATNRVSKRDAARANRIDTVVGIALVLVFGTLIFLTLRAGLT
jgi:hypothetical protein